jgi:PAS domain S-box-containing protein
MEMRVGELARRTGVGVSTLRAWERRFGFLHPRRSNSGHRLYTEQDVQRVAGVCRLVDEGLTLPAAIARVTNVDSGVITSGDSEAYLLQQVLHAVDEGVWVSQNAQTRYANRRMAEMLGCTRDELFERSAFDFIDPAEWERIRALGRAGIAGERQRFEVRMCRADGTQFVADVSTTPLRTPQGGYEGAVAVVRDLTDRLQDTSEARYLETLLASIGEAVIATAPDGTVVYANPAVETLLGWRPTELIGKDGLQVLPAPQAAGNSRQIHARLLANDHFSGEIELTRRDGSQFVAHVTGTPTLDEEGRLVGLVAVLNDSTETHRRDAEMRQGEQRADVVGLLGARTLRAQSSEFDYVLAEIVDATQRMLEADYVALFELTSDGAAFALQAMTPQVDTPFSIPVGSRTFTGYCAFVGAVVGVEDLRSDRRFDVHPGAGQFGVVSAIAAPIFGPSGVCGVVVAGTRVRRAFTPPDLRFIESMANVAGVVVGRRARVW